MRRAVLLALGLALVAASSGCGLPTSGLAFRQDDRLSFLRPDDRAEVTLPVTIEWEVEDFEVGPGAGSFAVFVDRAPQPPGRSLAWLARNDDGCKADPSCPDAEWFADRDVYPTTGTTFTIERLPDTTDDRREFHEVTVVLIDDEGRRVGETGWALELQVKREDD